MELVKTFCMSNFKQFTNQYKKMPFPINFQGTSNATLPQVFLGIYH